MKVTPARRLLWRLAYDDPRSWHTLWRVVFWLILGGVAGVVVWVRSVYR
jgi:hypothetical protein